MQLNISNYFGRFSIDPHSSLLRNQDKKIALAMNILSLGLFPLCTLIYRKIKALDSQYFEKVTTCFLTKTGPAIKIKDVQIPHSKCPPELKGIRKTLQSNGIPLHPCPNVAGTSHPVNEKAKRTWMEKAKISLKGTVITPADEAIDNLLKKAVDNIQHFTQKDLETALKQCTDQLNILLEENNHTKYSVGFACGKSQQWVASLSLKNLSHLPQSWFSLGSSQGTMGLSIPQADCTVDSVSESALVLFDDASYSGNQLIGLLGTLNRELKEKKSVYIVIPFMSSRIKQQIQKGGYKKLDIHLITSDKEIKLTKEIFQGHPEEEMTVIKKLVDDSIDNSGMHRTLCYTDWRFPDETSFPHHFGRVQIVEGEGEDKVIRTPNLLFNKFQTNIKAPYRPSQPLKA